MKFLVLAALLGLSAALQPGFEYTYRYKGRVALGMPSLSSQIVASAFYCDAKIQVLDENELRIQFTNAFIGDMNSRVTCEDKLSESDGYTKIDFKEGSKYMELFETPFSVKMTDDQTKPYQFPDGDPVWLRNIRRAFIHVLHIPLNAPNIGKSAVSKSPSFSRMENHHLGECPSYYTVTPLKEHLLKYYIPAPLDNDAQGEDIETSYWRLSKSVDFENCKDVVHAHTFSTMLSGKDDNDKCGEKYVSTTTTGSYTLKGSPRGVRIEKAVQEGIYIIDGDNVHMFQNQTLDLRSVDALGSPFEVSGSMYNFRQEMDSFSWQSEQDSGSNIDKDSIIANVKSYAIQRFQQMADALNTGEPFNFAEDLEALSSSFGVLQRDELQEIYDALSGNARSLYIKSLTATGLEIPYMFLLDVLTDCSDPVQYANMIDFLLNVVQNTKTTNIIKPFMDRVMNGKCNEFMRGLSIVNFASLATRMCTNPCGRENMGEAGCAIDNCKKLVEDNYLPWIEKNLNDESKDFWERLVYMMAIYNFNSEKIIPVIRPYVIGDKDVDIRIRVNAIYAFRKNDMPASTRNEIWQMLMAVFDNYQEHYRVREAAFMTMLSWDPQASWWHYMALSTWRDPNNYVVSLISNTIRTYKEYRPAARTVASLTKPVNPRSISLSFLAYNKDGTNDDMMRYWYEFLFSGNDESFFPRMISAYFRLGLINTNFDGLKMTGHFDNSNMLQFFFKLFENIFGKPNWQPDAYPENVKTMYNEVLSKIEMQTKEPKKNIESFLHMTIFNNFQALIPLMRDISEFKFNPEMIMGLLGSIDIDRQFFLG